MARLEGKTALITGATGGIGEATAKRFLNEGANVMLVARSSEKLKATRDRLGGGESVAQLSQMPLMRRRRALPSRRRWTRLAASTSCSPTPARRDPRSR